MDHILLFCVTMGSCEVCNTSFIAHGPSSYMIYDSVYNDNHNGLINMSAFMELSHVNDLAKNCGNLMAKTLELPESCTEPSIYYI